MSDDEWVSILVDLGLKATKFSAMTETRAWRIAKKFKKNSGYWTEKGVMETIYQFQKAMEALKGEKRE